MTAQRSIYRLVGRGRFFASVFQGSSPLSVAIARWNLASRHPINVAVEETPNERSLKFMADGHPILGDSTTKTMTFKSGFEASDSALAQALFKVTGVQEVMLANKHVTVTRASQVDWDEGVREEVE